MPARLRWHDVSEGLRFAGHHCFNLPICISGVGHYGSRSPNSSQRSEFSTLSVLECLYEAPTSAHLCTKTNNLFAIKEQKPTLPQAQISSHVKAQRGLLPVCCPSILGGRSILSRRILTTSAESRPWSVRATSPRASTPPSMA